MIEYIEPTADELEEYMKRKHAAQRIQRAMREWFWKPYYKSGRVGMHARKGLEECPIDAGQ